MANIRTAFTSRTQRRVEVRYRLWQFPNQIQHRWFTTPARAAKYIEALKGLAIETKVTVH